MAIAAVIAKAILTHVGTVMKIKTAFVNIYENKNKLLCINKTAFLITDNFAESIFQ